MENNQLSLSWSEKHNALESVGHQPQTTAGELSDSHGQSARWTGGAVIESWHAPGSMTQNQVARTLFSIGWMLEKQKHEREREPTLSLSTWWATGQAAEG